jgi:hypothetical protein
MRELCDEILSENMDEEAKLSMDEFDYNVWKMWVGDPSLGAIPDERKPQIDATYEDMAWQQKGSGHVYASRNQDMVLCSVGFCANALACWLGD